MSDEVGKTVISLSHHGICGMSPLATDTTTRRRFARIVGAGGLALGGAGTVAARGHQRNFRTHLVGGNEVPPVETDAQGQAVFQFDRTGERLRYKLIAANIEDVLMAHVHLAPAGQNGGVVVWLYPEGGPPPSLIEGRFDGVLASGVVTADDLVGSLAGESLSSLAEAMRAGETYVNVHTTAHPGGEIRGQIR